MIDESTPKGRIIATAMNLAKDIAWRDLTLLDIAEAAGISLADIKQHYHAKVDILRAFSTAIDDEVLKKPARRAADQKPRDAIFEVVMNRFDALEPYKPALRSIVRDAGSTLAPDPALLRSVLASQHWMLQAAGVDTSGVGGAVRTLGLASVYASVFHTWLDDDDAGLARTMAALDRRLRRGEQNLAALDGLCGFAGRMTGLCRRGRRERDASKAAAAPARPPEPAPAP